MTLVHTPAFALKRALEQVVQDPAPQCENVPAGQVEHDEEPEVAYVPPEHLVQDEAPEEAEM